MQQEELALVYRPASKAKAQYTMGDCSNGYFGYHEYEVHHGRHVNGVYQANCVHHLDLSPKFRAELPCSSGLYCTKGLLEEKEKDREEKLTYRPRPVSSTPVKKAIIMAVGSHQRSRAHVHPSAPVVEIAEGDGPRPGQLGGLGPGGGLRAAESVRERDAAADA